MKFRIQTHGRLQEWVAEEKGYFSDEGLDYVFVDNSLLNHQVASDVDEFRSGAFEVMESGMSCEVGSACHWAVNAAAASDHGLMWGRAYTVTPSGIYAAPESGIRRPSDLDGVPIAVGYHSGSHFSALSALQQVLKDEQITLVYRGGPQDRLAGMLDASLQAANVFGSAMYVLEQQGYRKIIDTTFMIGFLLKGEVTIAQAEKYFRALQRAQRDIDAEPWRYTHYFLRELPVEYHSMVDVAAFGVGERIVFEPYSRELYDETRAWMQANELFPAAQLAARDYEAAVVL